jgi:hypothetical protein
VAALYCQEDSWYSILRLNYDYEKLRNSIISSGIEPEYSTTYYKEMCTETGIQTGVSF